MPRTYETILMIKNKGEALALQKALKFYHMHCEEQEQHHKAKAKFSQKDVNMYNYHQREFEINNKEKEKSRTMYNRLKRVLKSHKWL